MEKKTKATARPKAAASATTRRAAKSPVQAKAVAKPAAKTAAKSAARPRATQAAVAQTETAVHVGAPAIDRDQVAKVAYSLFEQSGFQHGRALEHWLEAESRLSRGFKL